MGLVRCIFVIFIPSRASLEVVMTKHVSGDEHPVRRVLTFPHDDYPIGQLYVRESSADVALPWQKYDVARGNVEIPQGMDVFLSISPNWWWWKSKIEKSYSSPLSTVQPQDLQALSFSQDEINPDDWKYLQHLIGLNDLNLDYTLFHSQDLFYISKLSNLKRLSLRETNIDGDHLCYLTELTNLQML